MMWEKRCFASPASITLRKLSLANRFIPTGRIFGHAIHHWWIEQLGQSGSDLDVD